MEFYHKKKNIYEALGVSEERGQEIREKSEKRFLNFLTDDDLTTTSEYVEAFLNRILGEKEVDKLNPEAAVAMLEVGRVLFSAALAKEALKSKEADKESAKDTLRSLKKKMLNDAERMLKEMREAIGEEDGE